MSELDLACELLDIRHHLHKIPETGFQEFQTSDYVAGRLAALGAEVVRGVGGTGVVGTLRRGAGARTIGLRADMDALAIPEAGTPPYRSRHEGRMHACGHDGHMAMVLGAAFLLSRAGGWSGTVRFVFQPAEEPGKGAKAMLDDGLLTRFPMDEIYGIHNMPGLPLGQFSTRAGGINASEDNFVIRIQGRGAHAARPHMAIDPIVTGAEIVLALQSIVARSLDPIEWAVVSVTEFITDGTRNVIPGSATIKGDTRSYKPEVQALLERRMAALCSGICAAHGAGLAFEYSHEFEPTVNPPQCLDAVVRAAVEVAGADRVDGDCRPVMGSEDFGVFLKRIPGNYVQLGAGVDALPLHNPGFDFNDSLLVPGARYFATLARHRLQG
jgi:hippurate hydrolase